MFERANAAILAGVDELEIPVDAAALIDSIALFDRHEAQILDGIGAFDQAGRWREDGATSMTAWLRAHCGRSQRDAGRWAKTAKRLRQLPVLADAYRDGRLSSGQLQAIVANISDKAVDLFADAADELVPTLAGLSVHEVSTAMQTWAQAARDALQPDPADDPEPATPERSLHLSRTLDGRRELSGSLDPESGSLAETAFRVAATDDAKGEPARTPAERRADALTDILRYFLDHQDITPTNGRHRPHLNVFLDHDDLLGATGAHDADPSNSAWPMAPAATGETPTGPGGRGGRGSDAWPMGPAGTNDTTATAPAGTTGNADHGPAGPGADLGDAPSSGSADSADPPASHGRPRSQNSQGNGSRSAGARTGPGRVGATKAEATGGHRSNAQNESRATGGWLADGTRLDPTTVARLACDCGLHRMLREGKSSILDYGRSARTAPPPLFNSLVARDRTCRFPGCDRPAHWTEAHHVTWWDNGGTTSLRTMVLCCTRHHHIIHAPGWHARLLPDGTFEVTSPDGQIYRSRPPGKPPDLFTQPAA